MPKTRMNQIVAEELKGNGWKAGGTPSVLHRKDSIIDLVLDLESRTLEATIDVRTVVEKGLNRRQLEDNAENRKIIDGIMDGTVNPVEALLGTEFVPQIDSTIQTALQETTSEINKNLAGAYRNAMLERATALGRIAKVDETRTDEGLRVRITVETE